MKINKHTSAVLHSNQHIFYMWQHVLFSSAYKKNKITSSCIKYVRKHLSYFRYFLLNVNEIIHSPQGTFRDKGTQEDLSPELESDYFAVMQQEYP